MFFRFVPAFNILLIFALCFGLSGCTGDDLSFSNIFKTSSNEEEIKPALPAEQLYNEGLALQKDQRWSAAAKKFEEVERGHPYSEWAKKARLMTAYSYYQAEAYDDAATAAERYISLHPGSADLAYAKFLQADSYYKQIPDVTRDQSRTQKALTAFQDLQQQHPQSEYAQIAGERMQMARDQLAGKEMEIGRFYLKQKSYLASVNRFRTVVEQYQNTRHIEEALYRLVETYLALGVVNEAQTAAAVLGHNFPQSQWYKDAFALLQNAGTSPQNSGDSWISRAFKSVTG